MESVQFLEASEWLHPLSPGFFNNPCIMKDQLLLPTVSKGFKANSGIPLQVDVADDKPGFVTGSSNQGFNIATYLPRQTHTSLFRLPVMIWPQRATIDCNYLLRVVIVNVV
jgi:hypothetical protein